MAQLDWQQLLAECVDFAQRLIRTPSMSGEETQVAALVADEMHANGFDTVWLDTLGNVYGRIQGHDPSLGMLVLNSHTDHVDPGDLNLWPAPPYAAEIRNGRILGRGACDIKGPLAVQIYSMIALLRAGERPRRDVVFSGVVEEEVGGAGARFMVENLEYPIALLVLGEPSDNQLALGHRGIVQMWVTFYGRSAHASVPAAAENPNFALADFLHALRTHSNELSDHPLLGATSVAPTIIEVDTTSPNVTPAWTRVLLDVRTASESSNSLQAFVHRLAGSYEHRIDDAWCSTPTPLADSDDPMTGFYTPPEEAAVQRARAAIAAGMDRTPVFTSYQFATDGRHFVPLDIPIIGYSPGEEHLAHTVQESISIAKMAESLRGHYQLLRDF